MVLCFLRAERLRESGALGNQMSPKRLCFKVVIFGFRGRPWTLTRGGDLAIRIANDTGFGYTKMLGELRSLSISRICRQINKNILHEKGIEPNLKAKTEIQDDSTPGQYQRFFKTEIDEHYPPPVVADRHFQPPATGCRRRLAETERHWSLTPMSANLTVLATC